MGVPAFFAWLLQRYPEIIIYAKEDKGRVLNGETLPADTTSPNPHGVEFDNLYLDMNGIVHPCCHPEDRAPPSSEGEMMLEIFRYIDRIFAIVRPRRLLYLAIDGVAPRAKMNQQRARRFRAAIEAREKDELIEERIKHLKENGVSVERKKKTDGESFDSNCITPGTPFMDRLAESLRFYAAERCTSDPAWKDTQVILSDANVPGEGEHKIMDFIRRQRASPGYDPNMRHVIYGADADLIMLGLATHEPQFYVLREEYRPPPKKPCPICGYRGHTIAQCTGLPPADETMLGYLPVETGRTRFVLVDLSHLRFKLKDELQVAGKAAGPFSDVDRLIDDWIFMCCFVGNDFLPHLPSLSIHEGAIDTLVAIYKQCQTKMGGYLNKNGELHMDRVKILLAELGKMEDKIFRQRHEEVVNKAKLRQKRKMGTKIKASQLTANQSYDLMQGVQLADNAIRLIEASDFENRAQFDPRASYELVVVDGEPMLRMKRAPKLAEKLAATPTDRPLSAFAQKMMAKLQAEQAKKAADDDASAPVLISLKGLSQDRVLQLIGLSSKPTAAEKKREKEGKQEDSGPESDGDGNGDGDDMLPPTPRVGRAPRQIPCKGRKSALPESGERLAPSRETIASAGTASSSLTSSSVRMASEGMTAVWGDGDDDTVLPFEASFMDTADDGEKGTEDEEEGGGEGELSSKNESGEEARNVESGGKGEDSDVRFWEEGWKERYYVKKFHVTSLDDSFRASLSTAYFQGLSWVMKYYYQGCPSWRWFYAYHYAPFSSDFSTMDGAEVEFEQGTQPFKPLEQLMGVFPPASKKFLPPEWQRLMTEEESPIIEFYPEEFITDLNGKRHAWQGVALLPFVDESLLLSTLKDVYIYLTPEEHRRNSTSVDLIFVNQSHPLGGTLASLLVMRPIFGSGEKRAHESEDDEDELDGGDWTPLAFGASQVAGRVRPAPRSKSVVPGQTMRLTLYPETLEATKSASANAAYADPQMHARFVHKSRRLAGSRSPTRLDGFRPNAVARKSTFRRSSHGKKK